LRDNLLITNRKINHVSEKELKCLEEKEFQIVEPEILPKPSTSAISNPNEEETPVSEIFNFEDEYFTEFGDTSKYHTVGKPQNSKLLEKTLRYNY
jgi:hypothetical protein